MSVALANKLINILNDFPKQYPDSYNEFYMKTSEDDVEKIDEKSQPNYDQAKALYTTAMRVYKKSQGGKDQSTIEDGASDLIKKYNDYTNIRRRLGFTYPCILEHYENSSKGQTARISSAELVERTKKNIVKSEEFSFSQINFSIFSRPVKRNIEEENAVENKKRKIIKTREIPKPEFGLEYENISSGTSDLYPDDSNEFGESIDSICETEESEDYIENTEEREKPRTYSFN